MIVGQFRALRLDQLFIDPAAQRTLSKARARSIAAEWNWLYFTPLIVVKRQRKYAVANGQHGLTALQEKFPDYSGLLPCWVVPAKSLQDQAALFLGLNGKTAPTSPADKYYVGLAAGDEAVWVAEDQLEQAGIKNVYGPTKPSNNETRCGYLFAKAYRRLGLRGLRRVIRCVKSSHIQRGVVDPAALKASYIEGVIEYVARGGKRCRFKHSAVDTIRRAGRASLSNGFKRAGAVAKVLKRSAL